MEELIRHLKAVGVLRSSEIERALRRIDRVDFVPPQYREYAYTDQALPIVGGQTISQPYTVVFMLEQLRVEPGQRVLDVGLGSGWQAALLAELVGPQGQVYSVEYSPEVYEFGLTNLSRYDLPQLVTRRGDASASWAEGAPYDRIITAASGRELPRALLDQLASGGRFVAPVGQSIISAEKDDQGTVTAREFPGFVFVPLRSENPSQIS